MPPESVGVARGPAPPDPREAIKGVRIAIPGHLTTAALALQLYQPDFEPVVTPFDENDAVAPECGFAGDPRAGDTATDDNDIPRLLDCSPDVVTPILVPQVSFLDRSAF